jgi:diguanylate cyclase (GGDEF)-like protein
VLELVAGQAAPVIQNALVFEEAQEASLTDPLTGLANRRALQQHLMKELARAERQHGRLTVLLLDMDQLKFFNDNFGHHTGDRAIRAVASVLRSLLRPYDLSARFAGDEFVVVLWDCDAAQAEVRCRELQDAVAATAIEVARGKNLPLGLSAGAATFPDDGTLADDLLRAADLRMYENKMARKTGAVLPGAVRPQEATLRAAG